MMSRVYHVTEHRSEPDQDRDRDWDRDRDFQSQNIFSPKASELSTVTLTADAEQESLTKEIKATNNSDHHY